MDTMLKHIYYRITGHLIILFSLTVPLSDLNSLLEEHAKTNAEMRVMKSLASRFATMWNVGFQILYATVALVVDVSTLLGRDEKIPDAVKRYRYVFFAGVIFPVVFGVQMFWIVYFYDSELVFKKSLRAVISQKINIIVHTGVLLYALWELIFLPRSEPKKNRASWMHVHFFNSLFLLTTFYTRYVDIGIWPYLVLTATAGTFMFPIVLLSIWVLTVFGYHLQWYLKELVWYFRDYVGTGEIRKLNGLQNDLKQSL